MSLWRRGYDGLATRTPTITYTTLVGATEKKRYIPKDRVDSLVVLFDVTKHDQVACLHANETPYLTKAWEPKRAAKSRYHVGHGVGEVT